MSTIFEAQRLYDPYLVTTIVNSLEAVKGNWTSWEGVAEPFDFL